MKVPREFLRPGIPNEEVVDRKARFAGLNELVTNRHGWLTSIPGEREVTLETLEGSGLPDAIRALGYDVVADGEGQRVTTDAAIIKVMRYSFTLPRPSDLSSSSSS